MEDHSAGGGGDPGKDKFPNNMSQNDIIKAILKAYKAAKILKEQSDPSNGTRYLLEGPFGDKVIQMWYSVIDQTILTAWPK